MKKPFRLKLSNLQYFAGEGEGGTGEGGGEATKTEGGEASKTTQNEHMIPKSRFDEVNTELKDLKAQLESFTKAKAKDEKAKAEKLGEFEQLYRTADEQVKELTAKHETASQRVAALEGILGGMLETKMTAIPEEFHELIPEGMSLEQKLAWIDKAQAKGMFKKADDVVIGEATSRKAEPKVDVKQMSPIEKILASYSKQK
ncbi:hypothetical protein FT641_27180 [Bacillus paranthracis]|uniref:hypothetical protein n=1 Tax=Bacillus paranthracis TaxID=2026186 RepID=UPI00187A05DF|nr:hypothetical protein [Bacillus paranthracis]MBE7117337.1 hypothetical protein [Bacillus paranthracis]MBE7134872.1 hypothetical protein [Bacillus paranthracis]MBE7156360.1 hypothetical protein [Bacillus paranthracis]